MFGFPGKKKKQTRQSQSSTNSNHSVVNGSELQSIGRGSSINQSMATAAFQIVSDEEYFETPTRQKKKRNKENFLNSNKQSTQDYVKNIVYQNQRDDGYDDNVISFRDEFNFNNLDESTRAEQNYFGSGNEIFNDQYSFNGSNQNFSFGQGSFNEQAFGSDNFYDNWQTQYVSSSKRGQKKNKSKFNGESGSQQQNEEQKQKQSKIELRIKNKKYENINEFTIQETEEEHEALTRPLDYSQSNSNNVSKRISQRVSQEMEIQQNIKIYESNRKNNKEYERLRESVIKELSQMDSDDWQKKQNSDKILEQIKQKNENNNENYQYHDNQWLNKNQTNKSNNEWNNQNKNRNNLFFRDFINKKNKKCNEDKESIIDNLSNLMDQSVDNIQSEFIQIQRPMIRGNKQQIIHNSDKKVIGSQKKTNTRNNKRQTNKNTLFSTNTRYDLKRRHQSIQQSAENKINNQTYITNLKPQQEQKRQKQLKFGIINNNEINLNRNEQSKGDQINNKFPAKSPYFDKNKFMNFNKQQFNKQQHHKQQYKNQFDLSDQFNNNYYHQPNTSNSIIYPDQLRKNHTLQQSNYKKEQNNNFNNFINHNNPHYDKNSNLLVQSKVEQINIDQIHEFKNNQRNFKERFKENINFKQKQQNQKNHQFYQNKKPSDNSLNKINSVNDQVIKNQQQRPNQTQNHKKQSKFNSFKNLSKKLILPSSKPQIIHPKNQSQFHKNEQQKQYLNKETENQLIKNQQANKTKNQNIFKEKKEQDSINNRSNFFEKKGRFNFQQRKDNNFKKSQSSNQNKEKSNQNNNKFQRRNSNNNFTSFKQKRQESKQSNNSKKSNESKSSLSSEIGIQTKGILEKVLKGNNDDKRNIKPKTFDSNKMKQIYNFKGGNRFGQNKKKVQQNKPKINEYKNEQTDIRHLNKQNEDKKGLNIQKGDVPVIRQNKNLKQRDMKQSSQFNDMSKKRLTSNINQGKQFKGNKQLKQQGVKLQSDGSSNQRQNLTVQKQKSKKLFPRFIYSKKTPPKTLPSKNPSKHSINQNNKNQINNIEENANNEYQESNNNPFRQLKINIKNQNINNKNQTNKNNVNINNQISRQQNESQINQNQNLHLSNHNLNNQLIQLQQTNLIKRQTQNKQKTFRFFNNNLSSNLFKNQSSFSNNKVNDNKIKNTSQKYQNKQSKRQNYHINTIQSNNNNKTQPSNKFNHLNKISNPNNNNIKYQPFNKDHLKDEKSNYKNNRNNQQILSVSSQFPSIRSSLQKTSDWIRQINEIMEMADRARQNIRRERQEWTILGQQAQSLRRRTDEHFPQQRIMNLMNWFN